MGFYERFQEMRKEYKSYLDKNVFLTLYQHEIKVGFKSYLQIAWIIITLFLALLFTLGNGSLETINFLLIFFVFFGSIITVVISSASISGEIGGIADSLLSKSVKRWEYLLSKFISQITIVSIVYFLIFALVVGILWNFELLPDNLSYRNLFFIIALIGLVLVFFSSIGLMFSSIFSKTIFSVLAGIIVWFLFIFLLMITNWEFLYSPFEILRHFTPILENSWDVEYWKLILFYIGSPFLFLFVTLIFFYQRDL